jgi:hypothetical protein
MADIPVSAAAILFYYTTVCTFKETLSKISQKMTVYASLDRLLTTVRKKSLLAKNRCDMPENKINKRHTSGNSHGATET